MRFACLAISGASFGASNNYNVVNYRTPSYTELLPSFGANIAVSFFFPSFFFFLFSFSFSFPLFSFFFSFFYFIDSLFAFDNNTTATL